MSSQKSRHKIVIVVGGSAGISVAAGLLNAGERDVAVIDPAEVHYYQPLWTSVGGGCAPAGESARAQAAAMPPAATWIREAATEIEPDAQTASLASGASVGYDFLWCARAWRWTGAGCLARRRPPAPAACPVTTSSTWPRRPGSPAGARGRRGEPGREGNGAGQPAGRQRGEIRVALRHRAPGPAAERPGLDQGGAAGRPGQPRRVRADRQGDDAAHPVRQRVQPGRCRLLAEL